MNKERLVNQMNQEGIDVLLASTPENAGYITNFWMGIQQVARWVESYALISNSREKPILIASLYGLISHVNLIEPEELKLMPYGSFTINEETGPLSQIDQEIKELLQLKSSPSATEALIEAIKEENLGSAVIGIENLMPLRTLDQLKKEFPRLRIKEATGLLHRARMVKTNDEIEKLKKSATVIEKAIKSTLQNITEGISEIEAANELDREIMKEGAAPAFMVFEFGANGAHVDAEPTEARLKKGDIIRIDAGCVYQHYYSDTAKTIVFGEQATPKQQKCYQAIANGQKSGIEKARPGVRASEVFDEMMKAIRKDIPDYNRPNFGHSIGLEVWEPPLIVADDNTVLEKGMVINLEALYYDLGVFGLQVEDTLLLTETDNEVMTTIDETLQI